jgi:hypothetical protein
MNVINEIKTLLGMEVKLAQMKLVDGITVIEAESFDPDAAVFIVNGEDRVPMPVGDYELEDGNMLMIEEEGVIKAMMPMPAEDEEVEAKDKPMEEEEMSAEVAGSPKKIVESVSKETFFAEIKKLTEAIEALKPSVSKEDLSSDVVLEKQTVKPLTHSPEAAKPQIKLNKISPNRQMTTADIVMAKLFN